MSSASSADKMLSHRIAIPLYLALIAAGLAGNYFPFSILNAQFVFGSIFAMLALQIFGWRCGVIAAAIISSYTYVSWNHPWALLTMTAEAAVVGWLISRPKFPLVTADGVYWLFIGIPLGYLCMHDISNFPAGSALFLMTKQGVNGIANALLARLIFTAFAPRLYAQPISFRETLSNLLIFFVLFPTLMLLTLSARADLTETDRQLRTSLLKDRRQVTDNLDRWLEDRQRVVAELAGRAASLPPEQVQPHIEQAVAADTNFLRIGLLDRDAIVVAYCPLQDELGRPMIGRSYADRPYLPTLKETLKPMLSEVIPSRFGHPEPIAIMLAPVVVAGEFGGYAAGILNFERIHTILENSSSGLDMLYTLLDRNGNVIMTNRKDQALMTPFAQGKGSLQVLDEQISQWIPELPTGVSTIELWGRSLYAAQASVGKLAEWKLILEEPVAPYQKMLYERYTTVFFALFLVLIAAVALTEFLSRRIVRPLRRLGHITHNLAARVESGDPIEWPPSAVLETHQLIANFQAMAGSLMAKFVENRQINERLEQLVEERTEELRQSRESLDNILENLPAMVFMKDAAELRFVRFNKAGEELLGYSRQDLLGRNDYDFFPREEADFFTQKDREVLARGGVIEVVEEPIQTRHQGKRILHTKKIPLFDKQGKPEYLLGISQDITERKRNEDALVEANKKLQASQTALLNIMEDLKAENAARRKNEAEYALLIQRMIDAFVLFDSVFDADGHFVSCRFVFINEACERATGVKNAEVKGKTVHEVWPDTEASWIEAYDKVAVTGIPSSFEMFHGPTGKLYACSVYRPGDTAERFCVIFEDVTERRRAEEERQRLQEQLMQAQKMESVGRLAGGVAHDYNNMLGVIVGYGELALNKVAPDHPVYADLQEILNAARRSAEITQQLLGFARKQTIAPIELDLNETVEDTLKMLRRLIGEDIDLAWLPGAGLWPVKMDRSQLDQILANLCVNARDAISGVGKITIETHNAVFDEHHCITHPDCLPGSYVMLAVSDTGCGIERESLPHLFEPFFTTKEVGKGTGLGLAMVYGIVRQNQGFINVTSEPGRGTTFKLFFPRHSLQLRERAPLARAAEIVLGRGETVLLVEDEPALLKMDQMMLEKLGYRALTAVSPSGAVSLAASHDGKIDLLLTDVVMPQMTGGELALRLQADNPQLRCLYMSGYTADVIAQHGVLDETLHFIQKPFTMKDLAAAVRAAL